MNFQHVRLAESWRAMVALVTVALALLMPEIALAEGAFAFDVDEGTQQEMVGTARNLWITLANLALYVGLGWTLLAYVTGLGAQWIRYGVMAAIIGGFGEVLLKWIFGAGGMEVIGAA